MELAGTIASKSPLAIRGGKTVHGQSADSPASRRAAFEEGILADLWGSDDKNEAVTAFLEKTKARIHR